MNKTYLNAPYSTKSLKNITKFKENSNQYESHYNISTYQSTKDQFTPVHNKNLNEDYNLTKSPKNYGFNKTLNASFFNDQEYSYESKSYQDLNKTMNCINYTPSRTRLNTTIATTTANTNINTENSFSMINKNRHLQKYPSNEKPYRNKTLNFSNDIKYRTYQKEKIEYQEQSHHILDHQYHHHREATLDQNYQFRNEETTSTKPTQRNIDLARDFKSKKTPERERYNNVSPGEHNKAKCTQVLHSMFGNRDTTINNSNFQHEYIPSNNIFDPRYNNSINTNTESSLNISKEEKNITNHKTYGQAYYNNEPKSIPEIGYCKTENDDDGNISDQNVEQQQASYSFRMNENNQELDNQYKNKNEHEIEENNEKSQRFYNDNNDKEIKLFMDKSARSYKEHNRVNTVGANLLTNTKHKKAQLSQEYQTRKRAFDNPNHINNGTAAVRNRSDNIGIKDREKIDIEREDSLDKNPNLLPQSNKNADLADHPTKQMYSGTNIIHVPINPPPTVAFTPINVPMYAYLPGTVMTNPVITPNQQYHDMYFYHQPGYANIPANFGQSPSHNINTNYQHMVSNYMSPQKPQPSFQNPIQTVIQPSLQISRGNHISTINQNNLIPATQRLSPHIQLSQPSPMTTQHPIFPLTNQQNKNFFQGGIITTKNTLNENSPNNHNEINHDAKRGSYHDITTEIQYKQINPSFNPEICLKEQEDFLKKFDDNSNKFREKKKMNISPLKQKKVNMSNMENSLNTSLLNNTLPNYYHTPKKVHDSSSTLTDNLTPSSNTDTNNNILSNGKKMNNNNKSLCNLETSIFNTIIPNNNTTSTTTISKMKYFEEQEASNKQNDNQYKIQAQVENTLTVNNNSTRKNMDFKQNSFDKNSKNCEILNLPINDTPIGVNYNTIGARPKQDKNPVKLIIDMTPQTTKAKSTTEFSKKVKEVLDFKAEKFQNKNKASIGKKPPKLDPNKVENQEHTKNLDSNAKASKDISKNLSNKKETENVCIVLNESNPKKNIVKSQVNLTNPIEFKQSDQAKFNSNVANDDSDFKPKLKIETKLNSTIDITESESETKDADNSVVAKTKNDLDSKGADDQGTLTQNQIIEEKPIKSKKNHDELLIISDDVNGTEKKSLAEFFQKRKRDLIDKFESHRNTSQTRKEIEKDASIDFSKEELLRRRKEFRAPNAFRTPTATILTSTFTSTLKTETSMVDLNFCNIDQSMNDNSLINNASLRRLKTFDCNNKHEKVRESRSREPPKELLKRLSTGIIHKVDKKEMKAINTRMYLNLPEVKKRQEEKKKNDDLRKRKEKVKELDQKIRAKSKKAL